MALQMGNMIKELRKQEGLRLNELAGKMISKATLSKIENDVIEPDCFILGMLLQRLGKTEEFFELTMSYEEYQLVKTRTLLLDSMLGENMEAAEHLLKKYEGFHIDNKVFHAQYVKMMKAVIQYMRDRKTEEGIKNLTEALLLSGVTEENWKKCLFCVQELQLLLMIAYLKLEAGEVTEAGSLLEYLDKYIERKISVSELKQCVYTKCCYLRARVYMQMDDSKRALEIAEKGVEFLNCSGGMDFQKQLLEICLKYREKKTDREQLEKLQFFWKYAQAFQTEETMLLLLHSGEIQNVILWNEVLKRNRKQSGLSQDAVSDGVCSRETLSQLENGRTAHRKTVEKLCERLGVKQERYHATVIAKEYEVFEKVQKYKKIEAQKSRVEKMQLLEEIKGALNCSIPENKQFVETNRLLCEMTEIKLNEQEMIRKLLRCLSYTMGESEEMLVRLPFWEEFDILDDIAQQLKSLELKEEALHIYERLYVKYTGSQVMEEHQLHYMLQIYKNYAQLLKECNLWIEAEKIAFLGLNLALKIRRSDWCNAFFNIFFEIENFRKTLQTQQGKYATIYRSSEMTQRQIQDGRLLFM